ncbi:GNAT family N-acetyltransferase [Agrilactobacillus yilanensis]|uniref:GNAT family N-acetyltransferase n=1 Tax=Agrilactobacillus yilanensis TaxID=2485997 RepID=A0ABW4J574_9LACO|nr:GNAT family N-acetyltransferase [Agrilactobacillus yilanensis]
MTLTIHWATELPTLSANAIGQLFYNSFSDMFLASGFTANEAQISALGLGAYLLKYYRRDLLVAQMDGHLAGVVLLKQPRSPKTTRLPRAALTLSRRLRWYAFILLLDSTPNTDETYIDFLAVAPNYRQQGIASQLLNFCQRHFNCLNLSVVTTNQNAYQLYKKFNFNPVNTKKSWLAQRYLGFQQWTEMHWQQ